jgi:hypothetical protein
VGIVNKSGATNAYTGNNVTIGNQNAAAPTVSKLTIKAETDNKADTDMVSAAGGIGVAGVSANIFVLNVDDVLNAYTGRDSKLNLYDLEVLTNGNTAVYGDFAGAAVGTLASIAASVAVNRVNLSNNAYIGESNIIKAGNVTVKAAHKASSDALAIGGSGALVGLNGVVVDNKIGGNVFASVGSGSVLQVSKKLSVLSDSNISQKAEGLTVTLGYIALGLTLLDNKSEVNTKAQLGGGLSIFAASDLNGNKTETGEIEVKSGSTVKLVSKSQSGIAGTFAAGGTKNTTLNNSFTEVIIGDAGKSDIRAKNFTVNAKAQSNQNSFVDSAAVGMINAGIIELQNTSDSDVNINIKGNTDITANNIEIKASNIFNKQDSNANINALSAFMAGFFTAKSVTDIYNDTTINFAAGTNIVSKKDADKQSSFVIDLYNSSNALDIAKLITASLGSASVIESTVNNNSNTNAVFAGKIYAGKDLDISARGDQNLNTQTYIDAAAFISVVRGNSNSIANIGNTVTFLNGADIYAAGDLNLNLSRSSAEVKDWVFYGSRSVTDIYNMALVAIDASSSANSIINVNDRVNVHSGAALKSSKNVNIASSEGRSDEMGSLHIYTPAGELATKESNRKIERNVSSLLTVDGSIYAGANNDIVINVLQDGSVKIENEEEISVNYKTGTMNIINNIISQKAALDELKIEYGASPEVSQAIDAEISRLNAQLESLGFRREVASDDGQTAVIDVSFADVPYVEFDNMAAGRGDINIETDNVTGSGSLAANSSARVKITNDSAQFLRINDVLISDEANGDIFVNHILTHNAGEITDANKDKTGNSLTVTSNGGGGAQPVIEIINNGNPSVGDRMPNLELLGDIENPLGTVKLTSEGSIESRGTILARTIEIEAKKDFVQTSMKNDFIFHTGGDPRQVWGDIASGNENVKTDASSNANPDEGARSSIIANNVYISGTYLDINGLIQAGVKDWTLNVPDTIKLSFGDGTIAGAVRDYLSKNSSTASPLYKLDSSHGNLSAYYNVLTGDIEVSGVNIEGGKLYLYGNIINTSSQGSGKLVALDGYSRVTINNDSSSGIILGAVNTDKKISGEIKITDLAQIIVDVNGSLAPLETTYTVDGTNIKTVTNSGMTTTGQTASYAPKSGLRYTWTTGTKDINRIVDYYESKSFWGIDKLVPDNYDVSSSYAYTLKDPLAQGEYITQGSIGDSRYQYDYQYRGTSSKELIHRQTGSYSTGAWIFSTQTYWTRLTYQYGTNNFNIHSIKADNPISISFIGYAAAQDINITSSKADIGLRGAINAGSSANVNITAANAAIQSLGANAQITGKNITLNAVNGIGGLNPITVSLRGGVFNAVNSGAGDINLTAKINSADFNTFKIGNITTNEGDIKLISDEEIIGNGASSKIKGKNAEITSAKGAVTGAGGSDLEIDADNIKVQAYGDIKLIKKVSGDLGVDSVYSAAGDIRLTVENGSIFDINTNNYVDERKKSELLSLWDAQLNLFDSQHIWTQDQLLYAMNGSKDNGSQYMIEEDNFHGRNVIIKTGGSLGMYEGSFYVDLYDSPFSKLSETEKLLIAAAEYDNIIWDKDGKDNLLGLTILKYEDVDVYARESLTIDAGGYVYIGGEEDININAVKSGSNIIITGKKGIYDVSGISGNPNITGKNLTLESGDGDIGALNKELKISLGGTLTARSPQGNIYLTSSGSDLSVNYLSADKDVVINADGNVFASGYGASDEANIAAHSININAANVGTSAKNLNITLRESSGYTQDKIVNITADGNIYLNNTGVPGSLGVDGDLYYGALTAGDYVSVMSKYGAIYGFDDTALISAKNLILGAENKSIGSADNKIKAAVEEIISGFAKGDVYVEAENKGYFEEIYSSQGLIDLSSAGNIYADKIAADKDITIVSGGSIETGTQNIDSANGKITLTGKNEVEISAALSSKDNIKIVSREKDLKVSAAVISSEGEAAFESAGKSEISGDVSAQKDITADAGKELIIKGNLISSNGSVDLKSGEKTDIEGSVNARNGVKVFVENGGLNIKGAVRALNENINFNILKGGLIIGNKIVSGKGLIFADAYGDIEGDRTNFSSAGFYAGDVELISQSGYIGRENNFLHIDNENPAPVKTNIKALNGGIYIEGFTQGLTAERLTGGKDAFAVSNGSIKALDLGNKEANITAENITLHSLTGSIGEENGRIITAPLKEKGKVNLSSVSGIYLDQYAHNTFYSDYIRNSGGGKVSLLIPDNHAFIVEIWVPSAELNIHFVENKHVNNVNLEYKDIKKLMVNPAAVLAPVFREPSRNGYELLSNENIEDMIEKIQNGALTVSSSLLRGQEESNAVSNLFGGSVAETQEE